MSSLFLPLYIDPGTGSMLFSVVVGLLATLYFILKALLIKMKFVFSGKASKKSKLPDSDVQDYIVYCEGKQYITVFLPIIEEFEKRGLPILYLTSVEDDPAFNAGYYFVKPEYIGEGNTAFLRLNMLTASIVVMTTPGLNVYQLKRSKGVKHYAHILHMASDATMYRLFGLDYFDSVLLSGDYQKKDIRTLEKLRGISEKQLITVGCPYLDVLKERFSQIPQESNHPFTVLVSPSWGKNALLTHFGEKLLNPLVQTGFRIIVRPHPQSRKSETEMLNSLITKFPSTDNFIWDFERDNTTSLAHSDIMISDFSGIIFDYMFLCDKPYLYVEDNFDLRPYDAYDIIEANPTSTIWQFETLKKTGYNLEEKDFPDIKTIILSISDNKTLEQARHTAKSEAWQYIGESGKRIVDFMISTVSLVQNKNKTTEDF